ncbi:hypothetical protein BC940DRAFT_117075 [Gongronella butleri]|nr:hypothetical protein BC940DRAFT_117075 [Gongronella butleri]
MAVPHGCSGSDTVGVNVTAPTSLKGLVVVPQQVQNWTLNVVYQDASNKTVTSFSWTGGYLAHDGRQEFGVQITAPNVDLSQQSNVTLLFPTVQTCLNGTSNWTSDPNAPGYNASVQKPAPELVITNQVETSAPVSSGALPSIGQLSVPAMATLMLMAAAAAL